MAVTLKLPMVQCPECKTYFPPLVAARERTLGFKRECWLCHAVNRYTPADVHLRISVGPPSA
jgi:hypothetical protein